MQLSAAVQHIYTSVTIPQHGRILAGVAWEPLQACGSGSLKVWTMPLKRVQLTEGLGVLDCELVQRESEMPGVV